MNRAAIASAFFIFLWVGSLSGSPAKENPHGNLKIECERCHTTASWNDVTFDHQGIGFDLTLSHQGVDCERCHDLKDFSRASPSCRGCHPDVHSAQMGPDCERCHTPFRWDSFDPEEIHSRTRFPLLDRHVQIDCRNCHPALLKGDFATSTTDCVDCHEDDYLSTDNPRHVSFGIGSLCTECHEPERWQPAFFPSHDGIFPIFSGGHEGAWAFCADCHPDPASFSTFSCVSCHHRAETDDKHRNIPGYSYDDQACFGCHPTGSGEGGISGIHDTSFFPIFTGTHVSAWDACTDCHNVQGDFGVFTCLSCHEHNQADMDGRHQGIAGYGYDSAQCYGCHPTGEGGDFTEHDGLYFPIYSGKHRDEWDDCSICHIEPSDWSVFSCIECHEHSRSRMDEEHSEVNGYIYDSQACYDCHPTGGELIHWKERRIVQ